VMLVRLIGVVVLVTFCAFYAYLPGEYDALAVPLSVVAQAVAVIATMVLTPIGALWLLHQAARTQVPDRRYLRALSIAGVFVAVVASLVAWGSGGRAFGALVLTLASVVLVSVVPRLTRPDPGGAVLRVRPSDAGWLPTYVTVLPVVALLLQVMFAEPMAAYSRARAIAHSASLIGGIERYHATHGAYPESLSGAWADYTVSVVGIEQFHYARRGQAYNLHFEQPVPQISAPGTREYVVYNPLGQHLMLSHAAWHLSRPPWSLAERQGWYAARDAASPGWKRFLFD
jgi:hypothetical protein